MEREFVGLQPLPASEEQGIPYIEIVRSVLRTRYGGTPPKAFVHTYGCQQNVADGERIQGLLQAMGYGFTDEKQEADLILFNTCAVREHAEDRVFGNVGALKIHKQRKPGSLIALCGCMVQQEHIAQKIRNSYPFVDLVFGTHVIHKLPQLLYETLCGDGRVFDCSADSGTIREGLPVLRDGGVKAWLSIMYGCNNFCSYCVVPYVRGWEKSRRLDRIMEEAGELVAAGYKDITLLGQNVNSYGRGLPETTNFAALLRRLNSLPGDFRIRFMTSHPKDCTHELLDAMADCEKVSKHLHLPFQSGNNSILRAMNRGYTAEQYLALTAYAREKMPEISLTSDVIVGFPGEDYEAFQDTLHLVEQVGFTSLYTFIYSPRVGTPAADLSDPVPKAEKSRWFQELCALQEGIAAKRTGRMVGQAHRVLVEGRAKHGRLSGRTDGNIIIEFEGDGSLVGQFCQVQVTESLNWILRGELLL